MATYYLAIAGSDSNNGLSEGAPWATFAHAGATMSAGDTLLVRAGTYNQVLTSFASGTSWANVVRIANYPGETVWLRPSGSGTPIGNVIWFDGGTERYIEFDGINVNSEDLTQPNRHAPIQFSTNNLNDVRFIRFKNAQVVMPTSGVGPGAGSGGAGFILGSHQNFGQSGGFEVINVTITGGGNADTGSFDDNVYGVYVQSPNCVVDGCEIYNTKGAGIHCYNGSGDPPDNCIFRNNRIHDLTRNSEIGQLWGILISGGDNCQVYNNVIWNVDAASGATSGEGIAIAGFSNKIWHNTITDCALRGLSIYGATSTTEVRNNILWANGTNYYNEAGGNTTYQSNLDGVNPAFVNPGAQNFRLQATSPAIDTGQTIASVTTDIDGTARPHGAAYDIGAYENSETPPSAVTIIDSALAISPATGTTTQITLTGVQLGDAIVLSCSCEGPQTLSVLDDKGNAYSEIGHVLHSSNTLRQRVLCALNVASGTTVAMLTVSAPQFRLLSGVVLRGVRTASAVDASNTNQGTGATATTGAATATGPGVAIAALATTGSAGAITPAGGFTQLEESEGAGVANGSLAYQLTSAGAYTGSWNVTSSRDFIGMIVHLLEGPVPQPPPTTRFLRGKRKGQTRRAA